MSSHRFKLAMFLVEPLLPFEEGLDFAAELGIEYLWYLRRGDLPGDKPLMEMSTAEIDEMDAAIKQRGLKLFLLMPNNHFKELQVCDLDLDTMEEHPAFHKNITELERSMEISNHLGLDAVNVFSFLWPGEIPNKVTWPMRWMTRGGIIADTDMDKLTKAFSIVAEMAERHDLDVAVSMMPWNYTNTTGHFRRVAERVGSPRIKAMWGPADNTNCGELDVATAGFTNMRPYIYGVHLKDLRVIDGLKLEFDYCPIGEGDVDYLTVLRNLRDHNLDVYLSVSTHFTPPSGSRTEAMRTNVANIKELVHQVESEVSD